MLITDIQEMLQKVLNGQEENAPDRPFDYVFMVGTPVSYLEKITNENYEDGNYLPVFINNLTGKYTADKTKELNASVDVTIYFPLQLKNDITKITDYLEEMFVGEYRTIGSKRVLCNMSFPNMGGMEQIDVERFNEWVDNTYNVSFKATEPYMSLTFQLFFLSTTGDDFSYGKDYIISLAIDTNLGTHLEEELPIISFGVNYQANTSTQQVLGVDKEGYSLVSTSVVGFSILFAEEDKPLIRILKELIINGSIGNAPITLKIQDVKHTKIYQFDCVVVSCSIPVTPTGINQINMSLGKRIDING